MKAQRDTASRFKTRLVTFILLVLLVIVSISCALSLNPATVVIPSSGTLSSSSGYSITIPSSSLYASGSGTSSGPVIQTAINNAIAYAAANDVNNVTVYIPAGDWECDQVTATSESAMWDGGGAIFINLASLPAGGWLNIVGSYTNVTTTQQNGLSITCPATILRSYVDVTGSLSTEISTFVVVGSIWSYSNMNYVDSTNRHIRISGITILGYVTTDSAETSVGVGNDGIILQSVDSFLIDNCFIDSCTSCDINTAYSKGVVTNCTISEMYHATLGNLDGWGYGIGVTGNQGFYANGFGTPTWIMNLSQVIGLYNWQGINITYSNPQTGTYTATGSTTDITFTAGPIYAENCYFYWCRHGMTDDAWGYYVVRYCTFYQEPNNAYVDCHYPSLGYECYDNTWIAASGASAIEFRGGGGVIFNNTCVGWSLPFFLDNQGTLTSSDPELINNLWMWNNNGATLEIDNGTPVNPVAGVNYFTDSFGGTVTPTTPAPPMPGYVPLAYPNPWIASAI